MHVALAVTAAAALCSAPGAPSREVAIIPRPAKVILGRGHFTLTPRTLIVVDDATRAAGEHLAEALAPALGHRLEVLDAGKLAPPPRHIMLVKSVVPSRLGGEGYRLEVTPSKVYAEAADAAAAFYACETLRQLLPPAVFSPKRVDGIEWTIPCVQIADRPRFPWRGITLDSGRHIQPKAFIKRLIDLLALHRMNVLHWHLTDDQGWRVEIRRYPKLTEVGAWREGPRGRYGGFYTQDDIREIVAYARRRHVAIVPEIEMPGHSVAALTAYPELSCTGGPFKVATGWGVHRELYCAGKEETFEFLENVLGEVLELFPSRVIHIGGDEAVKDRWKKCPRCQARIKAEGLRDEAELQSYFIKRIGKFLRSKGRQLAGWDEIMQGGLPPNALVGSWHGTRPAIAAARSGHDVVMLPTSHCYFDYYQSRLPGQPKANGRHIPLERVYAFEPVPPGLTAEEARHILGAYGCLWTEYMPTWRHVEYMAFPRVCAMAEVLWSPKARRDLASFKTRLATHLRRLDQLDVNYFRPPPVVGTWAPDQLAGGAAELEWDATPFVDGPGPYEATFLYQRGRHGTDILGAALLEDGREIQRDAHRAFSGHEKRDIVFRFKLDERKPNATYRLRARLAGAGGTDSAGIVLLARSRPGWNPFLLAMTEKQPDRFIVLSEFQVWADAAGPETFEELNKLYLARGTCHSFHLCPRYELFVWDAGRMKRWVDEAVALGAFNVFCIGDDTRTAKGHLLTPQGLNPALADVFFRIIEYAHQRKLMVAVEPLGMPAVRDEAHFAAWLETWVGKAIPKARRADLIKLSIEWFGAYGYNPLLADQTAAFMQACRKVNPEVLVYIDSIGGIWRRPQPFHRWLLHRYPGTIVSHYLNTAQVDAFRTIGARNLMAQINPCEIGGHTASHLFIYHDRTVASLRDIVRKRVRYLSLAGVNYGYSRRSFDLFLEVVRPYLRLAPDLAALRRTLEPDAIERPAAREQVTAALIGDRLAAEHQKVKAEGPLPTNPAGRAACFGSAPRGCVIRNLAAATRGAAETKRFGCAHTSPHLSCPVQATFGVDFGEARRIRRITVVPCLDVGEDTYLATDFRLEYGVGGKWQVLPEGNIRGNTRRQIILHFPPVRAEAVRLVIEAQRDDGNGHYRACCQELRAQ